MGSADGLASRVPVFGRESSATVEYCVQFRANWALFGPAMSALITIIIEDFAALDCLKRLRECLRQELIVLESFPRRSGLDSAAL